MPPVSPMLAKLSRQMPQGGELLYEPKWDGFRCIVFRDGQEMELGSRNESRGWTSTASCSGSILQRHG